MTDFLMWAGGIIITGIFGLMKRELNMIAEKLGAHEKKHEDIDKKIDDHRLYAAQTFTTKSDIKEMKDEIVRFLGKIEDKLDKKQDK